MTTPAKIAAWQAQATRLGAKLASLDRRAGYAPMMLPGSSRSEKAVAAIFEDYECHLPNYGGRVWVTLGASPGIRSGTRLSFTFTRASRSDPRHGIPVTHNRRSCKLVFEPDDCAAIARVLRIEGDDAAVLSGNRIFDAFMRACLEHVEVDLKRRFTFEIVGEFDIRAHEFGCRLDARTQAKIVATACKSIVAVLRPRAGVFEDLASVALDDYQFRPQHVCLRPLAILECGPDVEVEGPREIEGGGDIARTAILDAIAKHHPGIRASRSAEAQMDAVIAARSGLRARTEPQGL